MKLKSILLWSVTVATLALGGYYGYKIIQRKQAESAMKEAIELGCADVVMKFEQEQDQIAEDIAQLIEKIDIMDIDDLEDDLEAIKEELADIQEDLVTKK